jgi:glycine/D-amino acid oxidase-like deaminating enzyme
MSLAMILSYEHAFAMAPEIEMIYAVAHNSRIAAAQFAGFCEEIGAHYREDCRVLDDLFDHALIDACFNVREMAFDASLLALDLADRLSRAGVECWFGAHARIEGWNDRAVRVNTSAGVLQARYVFNCTYASLDDVGLRIRNQVRRELAEIVLLQPPTEMCGRAVTVIDGPFFSSMPFPPLNCYSLTHVRYTPHSAWTEPGTGSDMFLGSRYQAMLRDAIRYMPCMQNATCLGSLYELKATLVKSEQNDSRPIVFEQAPETERVYSILGSKIDNVYDVLDTLAQQRWDA